MMKISMIINYSAMEYSRLAHILFMIGISNIITTVVSIRFT